MPLPARFAPPCAALIFTPHFTARSDLATPALIADASMLHELFLSFAYSASTFVYCIVTAPALAAPRLLPLKEAILSRRWGHGLSASAMIRSPRRRGHATSAADAGPFP